MRSSSSNFIGFFSWLKSSSYFSNHDMEQLLASLGGSSGVIENDLYISAYELLGCALVEKNPLEVIKEFLAVNEGLLGENPEQLYYFVESIIDHSIVRGASPESLIAIAPSSYKPFLRKRFIPR